jgi:hypothetical protein
MTQYDDRVQYQRDLLAAEEWANNVKCIHGHSLSSMWYDDRPQDTEDGKVVLDVEFNNGTVRRTLSKEDGEQTYIFGKPLTGQELVDAYNKNT